MSKINDGGPAFPSTLPMFRVLPDRDKGSTEFELVGGDGLRVGICNVFMEGNLVPHTGLTLRDHFAAKAMQAIVGTYYDTLKAEPDKLESGNGTEYTTFSRELAIDRNSITGENDGAAEIAKDSYVFADAMLSAREAK